MVWQLDHQESIHLHSGQLYSGNNSGSHSQSPAIKLNTAIKAINRQISFNFSLHLTGS